MRFLLIILMLIFVSCGGGSQSSQEKELTPRGGYSWLNDSTLVQYFGTEVCTSKVYREDYSRTGFTPNGIPYPIKGKLQVADTVHWNWIDSYEVYEERLPSDSLPLKRIKDSFDIYHF